MSYHIDNFYIYVLKNNIIQIISEDCRTFQIELDNHQEIFSNKDIKIISDKNKLIINIDSRKIYIPEIKHSFDFRDIQIIELKEIINNINNKIKELTDNIYTPNFGRIYDDNSDCYGRLRTVHDIITSKYKDRYIIHMVYYNEYRFINTSYSGNAKGVFCYIDNYGCFVIIHEDSSLCNNNMYFDNSKYPLPDNVISILKSSKINYIPYDMITMCNNISKDYYEKMYKLKILYEEELSINYNKLLDIISKYEK
jgi:hypothetical protein